MTATSTAGRAEEVERPVDFVDIVMLALAVFSVGLLGYVMFFATELETATWVIVVDTSICGVFLIEFLWRWRKAAWQASYPFRRWYEVLGMIPILLINMPALRGFRLLRIVVIVVRLARMMYRVFGEQLTNRLIVELTDPLVDAVKRPIIVLVLDEVVKVVEAGNIPLGLAEALRDNSDDLEALVMEKLRDDPTAGRLKLVPFHDQIVSSVIDTVMRVVLEVLADPRVNEFVVDVVRENQERIRDTVLRDLDEEDERKALAAEERQLTGREYVTPR